MRRAQHQKAPHPQDESSSTTDQRNEKDELSRFSRVKRVFKAGSLLLGRSNKNNDNDDDDDIKAIFGVNLEHVELYNDTGIPYVVYRLCNYIEKCGFVTSLSSSSSSSSSSLSVFKLSGGNPRLAEKLRNSFDKRGDADLESAACPATAATLLRQYFKELPQPLVPSSLVAQLLYIHSQEFSKNRDRWIELTSKLLQSLPKCHYHLLNYLINYLSKYESQYAGQCSGVCGVFAPVILPHVPPATSLLRDILTEASRLFSTCSKNLADNNPTSVSTTNCPIDHHRELENKKNLLLALKPRKRKEHSETCCQENKLIRSNSEERILVSSTDADANNIKSIRRVSSHEDFKTYRNLLQHKEMGHGVRCGKLPLHEQSTNVSPVSMKLLAPLPSSPCDSIQLSERQECDVEDLRSTERFSRSITPRGRRRHQQARRKKPTTTTAAAAAAATTINNEKPTTDETIGQSFLEMLSSGPSRSPSPARALARASDEDPNDPVPTNWHYQHLTNENLDSITINDDENKLINLSPRNSQVIPSRRFCNTPTANNHNDNDDNDDNGGGNETKIQASNHVDFKNMTKHINGLKKKIKKYEEEFENNFGYRPSHSDKMSNRDIKKLCTELNKLRKEYKLLKEDPISLLLHFNNTEMNKKNNKPPPPSLLLINNNNNNINNINNNNNSLDQSKLMEEMVIEMERKLSEKRVKCNRNDNMEEYSHEQLLDEKTALQKALLQIESIFGRPVLKEDRVVVRPLYDRYRTLKRLLIRASSNKHKDSISELATILEHEAMDFTSSSSAPGTSSQLYERRASEPNMSHRGILDCIVDDDTTTPTSPTESPTTTTSEILHSMSLEDLILQQGVIREEKKRLRRALKELELQFEARAGRKMLKEDRSSHVQDIYDSYKQTKGKLRLVDALIAKNG